jgi:hypothetical protein
MAKGILRLNLERISYITYFEERVKSKEFAALKKF